MTETHIEQAMRLAASRLATHAHRTRCQADALEQPQGFGAAHDQTCRTASEQLRRDAAEDQCRIDELHTLRAQLRRGEV